MIYLTLGKYLNYIDWNDHSEKILSVYYNKFGYKSEYEPYKVLMKSDYIKITNLIVSLLNRYEMRYPGNL